jgi:transposase
MDNLGRRKGDSVEWLINAAGADLKFLSPCDPDLNPVEKAFSKLKV